MNKLKNLCTSHTVQQKKKRKSGKASRRDVDENNGDTSQENRRSWMMASCCHTPAKRAEKRVSYHIASDSAGATPALRAIPPTHNPAAKPRGNYRAWKSREKGHHSFCLYSFLSLSSLESFHFSSHILSNLLLTSYHAASSSHLTFL